jgi:hypothetical protein
MVCEYVELFGSGKIGESALFVLVVLTCFEMSWQSFPHLTKSHDNVVVWLQVPTRRIHVPSVEFFLGLEEAGVVAVRRHAGHPPF